MRVIKSLLIDDSQIKGAISNTVKLREETEKTNKESIFLSDTLSDRLLKASKSIPVVRKAFESLKNTISGVYSGLGKVVSRLASMKNFIIGTLGAIMFSTLGTHREMAQGSVLDIGWSGARAKESTEDLLGYSLNFGSVKEALSSYDTKGPLAALGIGQEEASDLFNRGSDVAFFEISKKYKDLLNNFIDEAGGDKAIGTQNFAAVYGEGLNQILGMGAHDFSSLALSGQLDKYQSTYFDKKSQYSGINVNALAEGEKQLNQFMTGLKTLTMTLASAILPIINKLMGPLNKFVKDTVKWAKQSKELANLASAVSSAFMILIEMLKGAVTAISESALGKTIKKFWGYQADHLSQMAKVTKEKGVSEGLKFSGKKLWSDHQLAIQERIKETDKTIQTYEEDKQIRQSIRDKYGILSKEQLKASTLEKNELREYAKTLNVNITIKDNKGKTIGEGSINDVINKGLQSTVNLGG